MTHKNKNRFFNLLTPVVYTILLIAAVNVSVKATVSSFTSRTFYNSAVSSMGTTKNIDFSQRDNGQPITSPDSDIHINSIFLQGVEFVEQRSYYNRMFYNFPNFKSRVNLPPNTFAFGVDLSRFYGTNGNYTVTLSTGDVYVLPGKPNVHYFTFPPNPDFLGFTSDEPLQWVEYTFNNDYFVLDNFTYTGRLPDSRWKAEGNANDDVNTNHGTLLNGATFASGVKGQAFRFDGQNDRVSVPDSPSLNVGTSDFTVSFFAKFNNLNNNGNGLLHKDTYGNEGGYRGWLFNICDSCAGGGGIGIETRNLGQGIDNNARYPTSNFVVGQWYHIAAVRKSNVLYLYIDGMLRKTVAESSPTNLSNTAPLEFGSLSSGSRQNFDGLLDEINFFNRALSAADIQTLSIFDSTPPVIEPQVIGTLGTNNWYTSNVQVNWNVTESESSVSSSNGCGVSNVTSDTAGVTFSCTATSLGGTATQSVTIKRDTSSPFLNSSATAGGNSYNGGWTNQNVIVTFDCNDALSGVAFQTDPATLSSEGANQSSTGTCTDGAGNSSETTFSNVNIDKTAPEINANRTPAANGAGWNNTNVTANYTASDALSGLSADSPANGSHLFYTEGAGQTQTFTVTDAAGNSASVTVQDVNVDKTAPTINCGAADGAWHAADVSIACTSSDSLSMLANTADANFNLVTSMAAGTETSTASTDSRQVCDAAGNCALSGSIGGNKIDRKAPSITITAPVAGNYLLNQAVTVNFSCTDGGSGVGNCTGTTPNGGLLDTASGGAKTFTVSAADNVGNQATPSSVNYTVGFALDILYDQTKAHKAGSTVPVKLRLLDANGANVSSAATVVHAVQVVQIGSQASTMVEDAGNSNPDFDFRFDQTSGSYIFNLQTKGYRTGTYQLNFIAGSGAVIYSVRFQVRQ